MEKGLTKRKVQLKFLSRFVKTSFPINLWYL